MRPRGQSWIREGSLLGGGLRLRYRVGELLCRSETAELHALADEFERPLVLKCCTGETSQGEPPQAGWQREVGLLRRIHHPRVIGLRDFFLVQGQGCLVLERADGDLESWLRQRGPLAEGEGRELARQLLEGLHAIHSAGVLHLDLSPANVLMRQGGMGSPLPEFLIGDFGIGALREEDLLLSRPPDHWAHLPPELIGVRPIRPTPRCDLYGLGITLLHARLGRLPLANDRPLEEVERQVLAGVFRQEAERMGTPLGRLLACLLQGQPERRPASALEAWRLLLRLN